MLRKYYFLGRCRMEAYVSETRKYFDEMEIPTAGKINGRICHWTVSVPFEVKEYAIACISCNVKEQERLLKLIKPISEQLLPEIICRMLQHHHGNDYDDLTMELLEHKNSTDSHIVVSYYSAIKYRRFTLATKIHRKYLETIPRIQRELEWAIRFAREKNDHDILKWAESVSSFV